MFGRPNKLNRCDDVSSAEAAGSDGNLNLFKRRAGKAVTEAATNERGPSDNAGVGGSSERVASSLGA